MAKANSSYEIEYKLQLNQNEYQALIQHLGPAQANLKQENIFFDTEDSFLKNKRWALRLRHENGTRVLTTKGPGKIIQGLSERIEIEIPLKDGDFPLETKKGFSFLTADFQDLKPVQTLFDQFGDLQLFPSLEFKNTRIVFPFKSWKIELDHSQCFNEELFELEIECLQDQADDLRKEIEQLFKNLKIELNYSTRTKLKWADAIYQNKA